jgi:hypothetical protein
MKKIISLMKYIPIVTLPLGIKKGIEFTNIQKNKGKNVIFADYCMNIFGGMLCNTILFPLSIYNHITDNREYNDLI